MNASLPNKEAFEEADSVLGVDVSLIKKAGDPPDSIGMRYRLMSHSFE